MIAGPLEAQVQPKVRIPRSSSSGSRRRPAAPRASRAARVVLALSLGNLAAVVAVAAAIHSLSEGFWIAAALTYLPRLPYVVPAIVLALASAVVCRKWICLNVAAAAIVVGPIMGLAVPYENAFSNVGGQNPLKVVSYNVQRFEPDFAAAMQEVGTVNPDIVCLQECPENPPLLADIFRGWHTVHVDEYWIGSRFPLRLVGQCESDAFQRIAAIAVEVDAPMGKFRVFDVHQTTARRGLDGLGLRPLVEGDGLKEQENHASLREREAAAVRIFVSDHCQLLPFLAVGDFNTPVESSLYRSFWSDLTNAFDVAGFGFGYTAPVSRHGLWPDDTPWLRIDHVLASPHWTPESCWIGSGAGSDHRMVAAKLRLATTP